MFCRNRAPSPFYALRWDVVRAAIAFDNLKLGRDRADKSAVARVVERLRQFSKDKVSKDHWVSPTWVVYYADVFLGDDKHGSVEDLQALVDAKADEMEKAVEDPTKFVEMRKLCLRMHEEACRQ